MLAERIVLVTDVRWIYPVMWVTVALATLIQGIFLWGTAGAVVDTRQAKRLFPIFAAGGILGSVAGGVITRPLASTLGAQNLLLVWAGGLGAAFLICRAALGPASGGAPRRVGRERVSALQEMAQGFASVRRSRLLVWMTAAAVLFSILYFSLYLPYARAATDHFPDADRLAGFLGLFGAGVTGAAFLVSMLLTNRLFGWFGVATMVLVLPVLYAGAFGILLARIRVRDVGRAAVRDRRVAPGGRIAGLGDADQRRPGDPTRPGACVPQRRADAGGDGHRGRRGPRGSGRADAARVRGDRTGGRPR